MQYLAVLSIAPQAGGETTRSALGTVYDSILDGGYMMFPIGLASVIAMAFFVERMMALRRGRLIPRRFPEEFESELMAGPDQAIAFCGDGKSPIARIMAAGLRRLRGPRIELEKAVEDAGSREIEVLSGNLKPLVVVAAIAPLLGLLGTVIGMIKAFQVIAVEKAIGKPELLAEGISEALVTTAAGLIVAIPAQVAYFYLKARIDRFGRDVETVYSSVLSRFLDGGGDLQPAPEKAA